MVIGRDIMIGQDINIGIVDDEAVIRDGLREQVLAHCPGCRVETYATGEQLLLSKQHFAVVLLDIRLPGMSGMDVAMQLREQDRDVVIIFISALRDYVFRAFDVQAFHYLLKPVSPEKFATVLDRAIQEVEARHSRRTRQLVIQSRWETYTLRQDRIWYIESRGKKLLIHSDGKVHETYGRMQEMEQQLTDGFFRCHRCYLVNLAHVTGFDTQGLRLDNGECVLLSRARSADFKKAYMWYLQEASV